MNRGVKRSSLRPPMTKDDALRSDIRRLGNQLGDSLVRQHGSQLLELVEKVRDLGKSSRRGGREDSGTELRDLLAKLATADVIPLVRAFTTYFYLANVSEQVHRIDQLAPDERYLRSTVDRVLDANLDSKLLADVMSRLEVTAVFTAHPTEVARRSIITKRQELASLIGERLEADEPDQIGQIDRRTAELIDQIWQTDELRTDRPSVVEEARSILYYLVALAEDVIPELGDIVHHQLERLGSDRAPIRFGTWVGGDRDGNPEVTADLTLETLALQHDRGLGFLIQLIEKLSGEMSMSTAIAPISKQLEESLGVGSQGACRCLET